MFVNDIARYLRVRGICLWKYSISYDVLCKHGLLDLNLLRKLQMLILVLIPLIAVGPAGHTLFRFSLHFRKILNQSMCFCCSRIWWFFEKICQFKTIDSFISLYLSVEFNFCSIHSHMRWFLSIPTSQNYIFSLIALFMSFTWKQLYSVAAFRNAGWTIH